MTQRDHSPAGRSRSKATRGVRAKLPNGSYADCEDAKLTNIKVKSYMVSSSRYLMPLGERRCTSPTYRSEGASAVKLAGFRALQNVKKPMIAATNQGLPYTGLVMAQVHLSLPNGRHRTYWFGMKQGSEPSTSTTDLLRFQTKEEAVDSLLALI